LNDCKNIAVFRHCAAFGCVSAAKLPFPLPPKEKRREKRRRKQQFRAKRRGSGNFAGENFRNSAAFKPKDCRKNAEKFPVRRQ